MDEQLITELLQDIEEKVNTIHNAMQQIVTARTNLELFEKRMQSWKEDYNTILQRVKELEKKQDSVAGYSQAVSALREDITKTGRLLEETSAKINEMEAAIAELEKKLVVIGETVKGISSEHAGLINRQQETARHLEAVAAETAQMHHAVKNIYQQLADLKKEDNYNHKLVNNNLEEITLQLKIHGGRLDKLEEALTALKLEQKVEEAVAAALETPKKQILQVFEIVKKHHYQLQILANKIPNK
ncbi:MAG: hypothetical protein PWR22_613 [Moorella sp. (in: firmicutes)]|jgi:chromosome segregation ATPase|nr:hypothetical protein [Moorella sp. (in: firmicutes)]